ncbi:MAG: hypothetical protein ACK4F4_07365 [Hylemonella sp.]|uniref:hypothetical protein n=1 Tax=Hylemonella sp. TaxID=2066020 RepID=UPI00391CDA5D
MPADLFNELMDAMAEDLADKLTTRHVERKLIVPSEEKDARLEAGVVCLVTTGGGEFANWSGREGELGNVEFTLFCPIKVAEKATTSEDVERAELKLLDELLDWAQSAKPAILGDTVPQRWRGSAQTSAPLGWVILEMVARNV